MHYSVYFAYGLEYPLTPYLFFYNAFGIFFDTAVLLGLFYLITWKRLKWTYILTFISTFCWSLSNAVYVKYFFQYISFSAIKQIGNLTDNTVFASTLDGFGWSNILLLLNAMLFCYVIKSMKPKRRLNLWHALERGVVWLFLPFAFGAIIQFVASIFEIKRVSLGYFRHTFARDNSTISLISSRPKYIHFARGSIRTVVFKGIYDTMNSFELTADERRKIAEKCYKHDELSVLPSTSLDNVVFIIVESLSSSVIDMKVDGKEITPCLNRLKSDSTVLYNGLLNSNITVGQSSDGQFIYMTGLLPLRDEITVSLVVDNELPSLPKSLSETLNLKESRMVIPTQPSLWMQDKMCIAYGFNSWLSSYDLPQGKKKADMSDDEVFTMAASQDVKEGAFFSTIITMSMHCPYDESVETSFCLSDKSLPYRFRNYLTSCHFMDAQLEIYIDKMKKARMWDHTMFVIVSDHNPPFSFMDVEPSENDRIPLFIVNSGVNPKLFRKEECNQLDVYPTLLDIVGYRGEWRGLGCSLLSADYKNTVTDENWELSNQIIRGNFFNQK